MTRQDYNHLAEAYGRNRRLHPGVLERLHALGELDAGSRVLEVGCGTGNYISVLASETGASCVGVDPSSEMLRIARDNADGTPVTFIEGAAEALPLPDRQVDLAYSVDVIHHIEDRARAASEELRVLKPGGVAAIVTESEDDLRHRTPQVTYFPDTVGVELERYPAIEDVERELSDAGLEVGASIPVSMPHEVTDLNPYRDKAFSSLHLIADDAYRAGLARMERDLERGPIMGVRRYTIVTAYRP